MLLLLHYIMQKIAAKRSLYTQLLFTVLAFLAMVIFSSIFMSSIVHRNLVRNAQIILDFTEERVTAKLLEPKMILDSFAETVSTMISRGDSVDMLQNYINDISDYVILSGKFTSSVKGLYGYFETIPGGPYLLHSGRWTPPDEYRPESRYWYQLAVTSPDKMVETVPTIWSTNETIFTYALCVLDNNGRRLGVVCIDVRVDQIGTDVVNTALNQGGYGMLLNQNLLMLAHPHKTFVGRTLQDPIIPVHKFVDELLTGKEIFEQRLLSFKNEPAVGFFRTLPNGWHLGLVTPEAQYYSSVRYMAIFLTILGGILASVLIGVLIRIDAAREKSDLESRQKSTFLANMSHEIRTPINAIIGMTTIGKSTPGTERKDYCFEKIDDASQHLLGIINDILDVSKIEANKLELSPVEFHFEQIIQRVMNVISFRVTEKRQTLNSTIDAQIPAVLVGDDQRLVQVIINLLSNAVKFTPEGGSIYLNAHLSAEVENMCTIVVEITDTGIGIAPEHQAKIFRSFEQADNGTSRKFGGTGLGLVISKRIVEMMGGQISVTSTPGQGATFTFSFKAARGTEAAALPAADSGVPESAADIPQEFAGCHILLAEDVEINREIIFAYMEDTGAEIDSAENGLEVLKKMDENPGKYDLIFMDVQMPEMDGLETTRRLRARGEKLPIVAMTANVFKEDVEKCLAAGMNDHVGKPLDVNEVFKAVRTYWGQKHGEAASVV